MLCLPFSPADSVHPNSHSQIRRSLVGVHVSPLVLMTVAATPEGVGAARRAVGNVLSTCDVSDDVRDWAALVVSELVTNALSHSACRRIVVAVIESGSGELLVAVANRAPLRKRRQRPSVPPDLAETGRGLVIVRAMSSRTGAMRRCGHTIVWARRSADRVRGGSVARRWGPRFVPSLRRVRN